MRKVGKNTENIGKTLTTHVTAPLVGIGAMAIKASNDFQDGMAKVSTIADTTKVSMDTLNKGVIDLSNQTGLSVNELAEAEYQALSASVDTGKVTEFLGVATKAAKGGFTDTATAVNGLTNVLNAYGMEADKANKIANQMLITQNLGKTTFGELSRSMGKVTPVAANLGVKTEELFSSLAVTTAQGLDTAESVTAIKAAMSNIIKPSKEASEAAEQLGIDFSVSALKSKGWIGFLKDVKKGLANASPEFKRVSNRSTEIAYKMANMERAGKKNSKEYKELKKQSKGLSKEFERLAKMSDSPIGAMSQMFGSVEGLNSILMLTSDQGINKYNEAMKQMGTNTTAVQDAYDKMQTPAEKFRQSLNRANNSLLGVGGALTPTMETLGNVINKVTDKISKLTPKQQEIIVKFGLIAASVGPVIFGVGKATVGISNTITKISKLTNNVKKAGGVLSWFMSQCGTCYFWCR
ncbi:phage tail tape measure protein (plasmid) [Clostridiaceae bacterium 14S0207]|nr:phage tail tape measure protein [Clostridiaceae bacterium 14S0207]